MRDQQSQDASGAPAAAAERAEGTGGRHKELLGNLANLKPQGAHGPAGQPAPTSRGAPAQGAPQPAPKAVVPNFSAPLPTTQRTAPSAIAVPRASGQGGSLPASASTTPRGFPSSTSSTPTGAATQGSHPGPAPWNAAPSAAIAAQSNASILAKGHSGSATGATGSREGAVAPGARAGAPNGTAPSGAPRNSSASAQPGALGAPQQAQRPSGGGAPPQQQPQSQHRPPQPAQQQPRSQQPVQQAAAQQQQQVQQQQHRQQQQQQQYLSQAQGPSHMQMTPPPQQQQQQPFAVYPSANPLYGSQDVGMSPMAMARRDAYTPVMNMAEASMRQQQVQYPQQPPTQTQATTQQPPQLHMQPPRGGGATAGVGAAGQQGPAVGAPLGGAGGAGPPMPAIPQPGDLFNPKAVARAVESRTTDLQYLCEPPSWQHERPALTGLQLIEVAAANSAESSGGEALPDPADATPQELRVMERKLIEDLLLAFLGFPTQLVRPLLVTPTGAKQAAARGPALTFTVSERLVHPTLRETVAPLLAVCEYVAVLSRFVETRSMHCYGMVTHALAAALRKYLDEWRMLVAMMEHQLLSGRLDLTRLLIYCQEPAAQLAVLADVAAEAANAERTSADLLNLLHSRYKRCPGDGPVRSLLAQLLRAASAPYCDCLDAWLRRGVLNDPYHEFMVQEDKALRHLSPAAAASGPSSAAAAIRASSYWRSRYTLRRAPFKDAPAADAGLDVPIFLNPSLDLILRTGKYQNLLRECGQPVAQPLAPQTHAEVAAGAPPVPLPPLSYDPAQPNRLAQHVRAAHAAASSSLLRFLMQGRGSGGGGLSGSLSVSASPGGGAAAASAVRGGAGLMSVLRSAKHFFLLDQGDVLINIVEVCQEELSKPAKLINRTRLQSLLEMAIKTSSAASDPHADCLAYEMDPRPLEALVRAAAAASAAAAGADGGASALNSAYTTPTAPGAAGARAPASAPHTHTPTPGGSRLLGPRDGELPGWELFLPSLKLGWPLTLVLGSEEQLGYQVLFKHLWGLKRCERQLEDTWVLLQGAKRMARGKPQDKDKEKSQAEARRRKQISVAHALCHQLRFAVKELLRYATQDVLEPLWASLEAAVLHRAADVDAVMELHRAFLRRAAAGLLLEQPAALRAMGALQDGAAGFARRMAVLWDRLQEGLETASKAVQVSAAEIASEQARAAELAAALDDMQRLLGEASGQVQALVAAVRAHHEELMTGGGGSGAGMGGVGVGVGGGAMGLGLGGAAAAEAGELGGWNLEALPNLADRLDWSRPASGTVGAVMAEFARG